MRGDAETVKERLDIAEVISGYVKLEKAGANFKARCPFHNEKTPSFFISPVRQSFYCFGCGAKGDIFTFVEQMEGLEFLDTLKLLADKAGVEIEYKKAGSSDEKGKILNVLEEATMFFEKELEKSAPARKYIESRGINAETVKKWRVGYVPDEWRLLSLHLTGMGFDKNSLLKAGLIKTSAEKAGEPYDVFRDRIIFPLFDANERVIAFSGRALSKDTEPKYLNSPDTPVFTKSEVLYGLDKAKNDIRKKNYAVLVEGQIDLVLSHQSGVTNTVATSGTAFSAAHLDRLKKLSSRIILAFDGDSAGENAAEKASFLGISLGFEVKVAKLPEGSDPAEVSHNNPLEWKDILRKSVPAVEFFLSKLEEREKDQRKLGKLIESKILPMIALLKSSIEQAYFVSMVSKHTGIKEQIIWDDLKKTATKNLPGSLGSHGVASQGRGRDVFSPQELPSQKKMIEERLKEIKLWKKEIRKDSSEDRLVKDEEAELEAHLESIALNENLQELQSELARAESAKDQGKIDTLTKALGSTHKKITALEEKKKLR